MTSSKPTSPTAPHRRKAGGWVRTLLVLAAFAAAGTLVGQFIAQRDRGITGRDATPATPPAQDSPDRDRLRTP